MFKTTVAIDGMMCGHCEETVNDAIRASIKPKKVTSSHEEGTTVIVTDGPLSEDAVKAALASTNFAVRGIESVEESAGFGVFGGGAR